MKITTNSKVTIDCQQSRMSRHRMRSNANFATAIVNHHTINSLKRPIEKSKVNESRRNSFSEMPFKSLHFKFINLIKVSGAILLLLLISLLTILPQINCDAIVCPKDNTLIYPCSCQNGTQGLLIRCAKSNLAILSNSLRNLHRPIEQVEIDDSSISRLFGVLFSDSNLYPFHNTIRELDIRNSALRSIDSESFSLELLKNVQYLQFDRNQLQKVPYELINGMINLKLLNLSSNFISSIDGNTFSNKLTNLTELDLSDNKISRLSKGAFTSLSSLEYLNLSSNEISKLDKNLFAFGRKLRTLDLSNNKLTSLDRQDFSDLTSLESLRVANNQLTTIPRSIFSRNAKLYSLDLSFNRLEDIDTYLFKSVRFLKDLKIRGNLIKEITKNTFSPTTRIKRIDMAQNRLQSLEQETFKGLEWLEKVDLSYNQIVNISNDAFSRIYSVEIDLSHNRLSRIFYYAFHEVSNMTKLDLSHNLIDDGISLIAFEQTDCAHLDLSHNQIQDISKIPISNLTGIRILDISHNQITEFNKKSFTQKVPLYELHTIDASYNNISAITGNILERLKSIRFLNISHNSLRRLTSGGLGNSPTLLELDLSFNNLVEVVSGTLVGLVSMKNLDISYNRLKKMIPIPVALNSIHLEYNEISQLSRSAFPSLNSLLELYLEHNRISHIEEGTFSTLLALHTLSLSYNNLAVVPVVALKDLASLQLLRLDGNNIQSLGRKAFGTLPIVFDLYLDHNNISTISDHAFDGMLQLLTLNLSYNNLLEIPSEAFAGLVSLRSLDLSNNQLTRLENKSRSSMEDLLSLEVANFSNNKLSTITGKTFLSSPYIPYRLTRLDLSNNLIGIIVNNFANGLKKVEWLSLQNNIINEIYPNVLGNASHLKYLDLSHNKLRTLKEGTFNGQLVNLSTILLNNNKLTNIKAKEFDHLKGLTMLDLSTNRLESFFLEAIKWVKRGMALDLRHNNLDCSCNLLPFLSWIDSILARNRSLMFSVTGQAAAATTTAMASPQERLFQIGNSNSNGGFSQSNGKLFARYLSSAEIVRNTNCTKPEIMGGKSVMQMIDLAASIELNCDKVLLEEADAMKLLRAPIQYTGAEPYYTDGQQQLRIGWNVVDPSLDLVNFVIIRAKFQKPFELSSIRLSGSRKQQQQQQRLQEEEKQKVIAKTGEDLQLESLQLERVTYDKRTWILRGLDVSGFYVICISYETSDQNPLFNRIDELATGSKSTLFLSILSNVEQTNCIDLKTLIQQDTSERLVSRASTCSITLLGFCLILLGQTFSFVVATKFNYY